MSLCLVFLASWEWSSWPWPILHQKSHLLSPHKTNISSIQTLSGYLTVWCSLRSTIKMESSKSEALMRRVRKMSSFRRKFMYVFSNCKQLSFWGGKSLQKIQCIAQSRHGSGCFHLPQGLLLLPSYTGGSQPFRAAMFDTVPHTVVTPNHNITFTANS